MSTSAPAPLNVAVVGGGWAGLAAAVRLVQGGALVTLFEMAPQLGGRARSVGAAAARIDNGQHILIGAYKETLALMQAVGLRPQEVLLRAPLNLRFADGRGLALPPGAAAPAFVRGVLAAPGWRWADKWALLRCAAGWAVRRFRCPAQTTVAQLCAGLPAAVQQILIEPLCVAALNTPAAAASGEVFLRVLRDALFSGPGASDLLLPKAGLDALWPQAAQQWLLGQGASIQIRRRVERIDRLELGAQQPGQGPWRLDEEAGFHALVLATTAVEAARLARPLAPAWAATAEALRYEPIVTVYAHANGARLSQAMLALDSGAQAPAQFVFDQGQLGGPAGQLAFVVSGAAPWVQAGSAATTAAVLAQAQAQLGLRLELRQTLVEKRATFACTPALLRPSARLAPGLWAAGDHIEGPYPATLEAAMRSGSAAASGVLGEAAAR